MAAWSCVVFCEFLPPPSFLSKLDGAFSTESDWACSGSGKFYFCSLSSAHSVLKIFVSVKLQTYFEVLSERFIFCMHLLLVFVLY